MVGDWWSNDRVEAITVVSTNEYVIVLKILDEEVVSVERDRTIIVNG